MSQRIQFSGRKLSMASGKGIASIAIIAAICIGAAIIGIVSDKYLGPHNEIENIAETIIKDETGMSVDLSQEKK